MTGKHRHLRSTDDGFILLETLIAIVLIAVVMAGFTTFFVNSVAFTSQQRATQVATQIANSTVEAIRALPASDPVIGRDAASVRNQFDAASAAASPWLAAMTPAVDRAAPAGSGATATVPTAAAVQKINNVDYRVSSFLGTCVIPTGMTQNATCASGSAATGIGYLRTVVEVNWTGARCPPAGCNYLTSTLLNTIDDPLFNLSQSPPAAPVLTAFGAQISAVGDLITLPARFTAVPTSRFAITSGNLPAGLILNPATGVISGTPSLVTPSTALTLTLTDGFGRTATTSFSWTVLAALTTTPPAPQASLIGTALALTLPPATGGSPGYTWSDPAGTLPPGLTVSTVADQAVVTGTPTARGIFPVTLTVADSTTTRKSTVSFSWTTDYPPLVATNPGPQTSTVGTADSVTLSVTGGSGSFSWTGGETLPAGLTLNNAGAVSGVPTAPGVAAAVLMITDSKSTSVQSVPFTWTVFARPTVIAPAEVNSSVGRSVSVQLATTCPNAPCSYALANGPSALGISSTGLLTGTFTTAQPATAVAVVVTDAAGASTTSATFTITVNAAPSISSPGNQTTVPGMGVSVEVSALTAGGTAPLTYSATSLPSWLTLNATTGRITGTAPATATTTGGIILTITDAAGVVASSPAFSWTVFGGPPSEPLAVTVVNGDSTVTTSWTAPTNGPVTLYTASFSPGGASCVTVALSCSVSGLTNGASYAVTVTATNLSGPSPPSPTVQAIPYPAVMSTSKGLTLWLDGADPQTLLGNSDCTGPPTATAVGCWKDKSGRPQANNFVQATASNRPGVSSWNGLPAANFADTSDVLSSVNASANYLTVFMAANVTNSDVYINMFGQTGVDYDVRIGSGTSRSAPNGNDWSFNPAGTLNWINGAKLINANGPLKLITSDQARDVKTFTASVSNPIYNGRGMVGQVGDVITFDRALDIAERRSVEEYLARKWGVTITPQAPATPTGAVSTTTSATVSWTAPTFNGGSAVTGYTVTSSPGNKTCTTTGVLFCPVTGLTKGTTYTFSVTATNSAGVGPASSASAPVKP